MYLKPLTFLLLVSGIYLASPTAYASDSLHKIDTSAVLGGAIGGGVGAAAGSAIGGRNGAIVGSAVGAAAGVAIAAPGGTVSVREHEHHDRGHHYGHYKHRKHHRDDD